MDDVKVFAMDDCTWYAAASVEEAKRAYLVDCGLDESDLGNGYPRELTDAELGKTLYVEDPYDRPDTKTTFREALDSMVERGQKFPCFFASTEW